jgi:hypothetical protein
LKSQLYFGWSVGARRFIILHAGDGISDKRAYIDAYPEMTGCRLARSATSPNSDVISIAFS